MAFWLSGDLVAFPMDDSSVKAYFGNQGHTVSPFLSRLAEKDSITLITAYSATHLNVEADSLLQGWVLPEWHLFFLHCPSSISNFWVNQRWICWHLDA